MARRLSLFLILTIIMVSGTRRYRVPFRVYERHVLAHGEGYGKEALLLSRFDSFSAFTSVVKLEYFGVPNGTTTVKDREGRVRLSYEAGGDFFTKELTSGISQRDLAQAQNGGLWGRIMLALRAPHLVWDVKDLKRVNMLSRRDGTIFRESSAAFYDLALAMVRHISAYDQAMIAPADLSEKGYLNTFNHITAQAFVTAIFSERLANFIADAHERYNMPELTTGDFTPAQIADVNFGPTDNYVDIINNECGQKLGKQLRKSHHLNRHTTWTPILLAQVLNDVQAYFSWAFQIGFIPFKPEDDVVIKFYQKINLVMEWRLPEQRERGIN